MPAPWPESFAFPLPDLDKLVQQELTRCLCRDGNRKIPTVTSPLAAVSSQSDYRIIRWPKIFIPVLGNGRIVHPGGSLLFSQGQIAIIPPRFPHRFEAVEEQECYFHLLFAPKNGTIYYNGHLYQCAPRLNQSIQGIEREIGRSDLIRALTEELAANFTPQAVTSESLLISLLSLLKEELSQPSSSVGSVLVNRCRTYIEQELSDPRLSVGNIASELRVHPDYLSRLFHAETGTRLISYIQSCRVQLARELLSVGKLYPTEASHLAGFSDPGYFTKVFRRIEGITPSEYRARSTAKTPAAQSPSSGLRQ